MQRPKSKRASPPRAGGRIPLHGRPLPKPSVDRTAPPPVEILSIGRELLRGRLADGNGPRLADELTRRGGAVLRITVVDDTSRAIAAAFTEALARGARFVVSTGGLGPGADDRTLEAVAEALGRPLTDHPGARRMVEQAYRRLHDRGLVSLEGLNAAREKMCSIPVGSEPIPNPVGAAPGILIRLPGGAALVALPGVPEEAQAVLQEALRSVRELFAPGFTALREVETPTKDESALQPMLDRVGEEFPGVSIKAHVPGFRRDDTHVVVTLEATAENRSDAEAAVEGALRRLLALAGGGR